MSANVWNPGSDILSVNANTTLVSQNFIATEGQTTFNLTLFRYATNVGSLLVFRNGQLLSTGVVEDSPTSFSLLSTELTAGEVITAYGFVGITAEALDLNTSFSQDIVYPPGSIGAKSRQLVSVMDAPFAARGDGVTDDTVAIQTAWDSLADGGHLVFPSAVNYKISDTLRFTGKARCTIDFNGQWINAASFAGSSKPAVYFNGIPHCNIDGLYVLGNKTFVNTGIVFDASPDSITIHALIGKVYAANCNIGIFIGNSDGSQFSDSQMLDLYASDCNIGIYFTGENTLAMQYGRVAAYNNVYYGVLFEQGGGSISSLQVAASGIDLFFGSTSGVNGSKLNRWDIVSGYSEEGVNGEIFISSAACTDADPFREQIVLRGFRCTPFSSTNVQDFIKWNLNGDLIMENFTFGHGTQLPQVKIDHNSTYRAPRVVINDSVIDCSPKTAGQVALSYNMTNNKATVEINSAVDNGLSFWNNGGAINEGIIKRGIYTSKLRDFERALRSIGGLKSAWNLADISSGTCKNLNIIGPSLAISATLERRDFWLDDGLVGFFKNATNSKTISTSSSYLGKAEYTFGMILRTTGSGTDETSNNALGGSVGMRLGIGNTGSAFVRCQVGAFNAQAVPTNPYDPHLVIGRWLPGTHTKVDAINLRTGEVVSASVGGPNLVDVTWADGFSTRNDLCVRGFPFIYSRSLTDNETFSLLQSAMLLTDSWRY